MERRQRPRNLTLLAIFWKTECVTTLSGIPSKIKKYYPDGTISPSKLINRFKFVEEYYDGMPAPDIVNRNAQFLLGVD